MALSRGDHSFSKARCFCYCYYFCPAAFAVLVMLLLSELDDNSLTPQRNTVTKTQESSFQQISLVSWPYAEGLLQGKGQEEVGVDWPIGSLCIG